MINSLRDAILISLIVGACVGFTIGLFQFGWKMLTIKYLEQRIDKNRKHFTDNHILFKDDHQ